MTPLITQIRPCPVCGSDAYQHCFDRKDLTHLTTDTTFMDSMRALDDGGGTETITLCVWFRGVHVREGKKPMEVLNLGRFHQSGFQTLFYKAGCVRP